MGAFAAAVMLILARVADEKPAILALPWSVIMMVCGVTVLTSLAGEDGRNRPVHDDPRAVRDRIDRSRA